jgi:hypothetical protein
MSELFGANVIEIAGTPMLLTATGGGTAVHLAAPVRPGVTGRSAVLEHLLRPDRVAEVPALVNYDLAALTQPRWSPATLCGRQWSEMVGGDGGVVSLFGVTAFAPTCRRCLASIDRSFAKPVPDGRLALVARLAADKVIETGHAEVLGVPGDQQQELRSRVKGLLRQQIGHSVTTHVVSPGRVLIVCDVLYDKLSGHKAAEAIARLPLPGQDPLPPIEPDWIVSWDQWDVS